MIMRIPSANYHFLKILGWLQNELSTRFFKHDGYDIITRLWKDRETMREWIRKDPYLPFPLIKMWDRAYRPLDTELRVLLEDPVYGPYTVYYLIYWGKSDLLTEGPLKPVVRQALRLTDILTLEDCNKTHLASIKEDLQVFLHSCTYSMLGRHALESSSLSEKENVKRFLEGKIDEELENLENRKHQE